MTLARYVSKHLLESLHTSALMLLMSLLGLGLCFFLLGLCGYALVREGAIVPQWLAPNTIVVYLHGDSDPGELDKLVGEVSGWPGVERVHGVSRQQAHEQLRALLGSRDELLDGLEDDFLPPSVQITLKTERDPSKVTEDLVARLRQSPSIAEILYGKGHGEWLQSLAGHWTNVWLGLGVLVILVSIGIVSNATRIAFARRKSEVHIYRLIGATPFVVKLPHYIQGVLLGSLAASLAAGLLAVLGAQVHRAFPTFWGAALGIRPWEGAALLAGILICGAACGWLGTRVGLGKSF